MFLGFCVSRVLLRGGGERKKTPETQVAHGGSRAQIGGSMHRTCALICRFFGNFCFSGVLWCLFCAVETAGKIIGVWEGRLGAVRVG